jgi:hypothetical protein
VSVGARALTGEAYEGHVFWDTELYMVPFYTFTHPPSARALLAYRYHMRDAAQEKARREVSTAPCTRGNRPIRARKRHHRQLSRRAEKS